MKVKVRWGNGASGQMHLSLFSATLLKLSARVVGEHGELYVMNPYLPHLFNRFTLRLNNGDVVKEKFTGDSTYTRCGNL